MTSEAEFFGGPMHGEIMTFPGDEPPDNVLVSAGASFEELISALKQDDEEDIILALNHFVYRREVSSLDEGPAWVYVPVVDY